MTDKEKIKQEIERLRDIDEETSHLNKESFNSGRWKALTQIKAFIDSLPEELASEDLKEEMIRWHREHFGNKRDWEKTSGEYLTRKSQLDIARHFAEWQRDKDAVPSCKNLYDAIKEEQEKKNFHDDFEKASYTQGMIDGSMWQKQQMKEVLQTEYEKGRFDMKEEMMKDAVECIVEDWCGDSPEITIPLNSQDFKNGDRVKTIILKNE